MTRDEAWNLANDWVAAWNAHDLDKIMSHYEDGVALTSPVAARLLGIADGHVNGKANLRAYFERGLAAFPDLTFTIEDVLWGSTAWFSTTPTREEPARRNSWSWALKARSRGSSLTTTPERPNG